MRASATWLFPFPDKINQPGDSTGHGTKMLTKITGKRFGVSKKVRPVIVRVPTTGLGGDGATEWVTAVKAVRDDYKAKIANGWERKRPGIVNLSFAIAPARLTDALIKEFRECLEEMIKDGLFPIAGSGNLGGQDPGKVSWNSLSSNHRNTSTYAPRLG